MNLSYQILKERYIDLRKSHKTLHDEVLRLQQENQQLKEILNHYKSIINKLDNETLDNLPFDIAEEIQELKESDVK